MATKVVVCPECESPVEAGRFSCASCGAVVAAVATVARSFAPAPAVTPTPVEELVPEPGPPAEEPLLVHPVDAADDGWDAAGDEPLVEEVTSPEPEPQPESVAEPVAAPVAAAAYAPAPPATSWPETPAWPVPVARSQPLPRSNGPMWATAPVAVAEEAETPEFMPPAEPARPAAPAWPPTGAGAVALEPPVRTPAGAYLPPSAVLPPGEALPVNGHHTNGHVPQDAAAGPPKTLAERLALGDADGPLGLPANAAGRTIALGAAIAGLGFILPWAEIVIGSSTMGGFLDMWGLAGPGHPIVVLLLIGVGILAVAHEKWPINVGAGTAAIVLGSVLLGLAFPYVMGPFREAIGVYVTAAGAVVMIAGGLLARMPRRHADDEARV